MDKKEFEDNTRAFVPISSGTMISHYKIIEKIGAGGMGEVYTAEDTKLGRKVAMKFLPSHLASNDDIKIRFVREAQTIARLNHPNIVSIHDVSEFNERPYYVMELVEGESLHAFAHDKTLPFDIIVDYAIQICQGLGEAHRAGIVHRDVKAANIIVDKKGRIRLLDFGLAAMAGDDRLTRTGSTLGTVSYMSPEQVSGREIDHRSDLFSLGIVLYELVAGQAPFKRDSEGATLKAIMEDPPEPLTRYKADVPDRLQDIVMKLLEKDKELRYQSAEGVIADLKRLIYDSTQTSYSKITTEKPKRRKRFVGISATAAVLVAVGLYFIFGIKNRDRSVAGATPMIAVKPFENLGSPEDEYFADGITDEITSRLAGIAGLGVISRTSAMVYKNSSKNLKQIGQELGVDYILEGTVRWSKAGDKPRVRITPQLVRVSDDRHVWADNYEREMLEVFAVQADIAAKIVDQLGISLVRQEKEDLNNQPTDNAEAYALYLRALSLADKTSDPQAARELEASIDSAIALDPDFALAYTLRSVTYSWKAFWTQDTLDIRIAIESAERALQLKPGLPESHLALGNYHNLIEEDYDRALEEFNIAKPGLPNEPFLFFSIAMVQMRQGNFQDAIENFRKATVLDPLNSENYKMSARCLSFTHSFDEAIIAIDRAITLEPSFSDYWEVKLDILKSWYGDWDVLTKVAREALLQCDSVEFLPYVFYLNEQLPEIEWDRFMRSYRDSERGKMENIEGQSQLQGYYTRMISMNRALGNGNLMRAYADSVRVILENKIEINPGDFHSVADLGLTYSTLGDCERAVELGQRGIDMLTVDDCHW